MIELYTLMGDKYIESFDEKSIMAHRLLAFKKVEYKNVIASVDSLVKNQGSSIGMFPMIRHQGIVHHTIESFETLLSSHPPNLAKESFGKPFFIKHVMEWALDSLSKKMRYYLLLEPDNWSKLEAYLRSMYGTDEEIEVMNNLRKVTQVVYKNSMFSRLDYMGKLDAIEKDFAMIDHWASEGGFLTGQDITLADFAVFSVVHLLFHPYIAETQVYKDQFPHLNSWAITMDNLTKNEFTKAMDIKLV